MSAPHAARAVPVAVDAPPPLRILHIVDSLAGGGMPTLLARVVERTRGRFDYAVCCLRELGPTATRLRAASVPVHFLGKRDGNDWSLAWGIARLCRATRPQVVHTHNWGAIDGVVGARLARVPVVVHGEHGRDAANAAGEPYRRTLARRALAPCIDRIVAVSEDLCRWQIDAVGIRPDKLTVVRNGVEPGTPRNAADRERVCAALGFDTAALLIGAVGRLDAVKNYPALIEAFRSVSERHPAARLVVLGDGPQRAGLERQIRAADLSARVHLVGHREDVAYWLAALDVFVQSSLMEGTPNAVLEAMAAGLPVVATRVGGSPEVVLDGETGRLVPPADRTALADAIAAYCASAAARAAHGAAGRARVERHYTLAATAAQYCALYDELAGASLVARQG